MRYFFIWVLGVVVFVLSWTFGVSPLIPDPGLQVSLSFFSGLIFGMCWTQVCLVWWSSR